MWWIWITIKQEHQAPNINRFASSIRAHWDAIWWLAISSLNQNQYALYCIVCAFELVLVRLFVCNVAVCSHLFIYIYIQIKVYTLELSVWIHVNLHFFISLCYLTIFTVNFGWLARADSGWLFVLLEAHCNWLEGFWTICCILQCDKNYKVRLIWHDRLKQHSKMLLVIPYNTMAHLYWNSQTWNKTVC